MQKHLITLSLNDELPLTCTRTGTCCHGNQVFINPWEVHFLAKSMNLTSKELIDKHLDLGGIRLRFDGPTNNFNKSSCSLYDDHKGCTVHQGRPLACRLYPIGRKIQNYKIDYIYSGEKFPCLNECPEVLELPLMSISNYLVEQKTVLHEQAQDSYLEVMQNLADVAFTLLLETPLKDSKAYNTLDAWKRTGQLSIDELVKTLDNKWVDVITAPEIIIQNNSLEEFIETHNEMLQSQAQKIYGELSTPKEIHDASVTLIGCALYLAKSIGSDMESLAEHWVETAIQHGAHLD